MQKIVVSSLLAVLLVSGTSAFAQFKNPVRTVKNLVNLEHVVARAAKPSAMGRQVVLVPAGIIAENKIALTSVPFPMKPTSVNQSLNRYARKKVELEEFVAASYIHSELLQMPSKWVSAGGKAFYTNQTKLARDLDHFYTGNTQVYIGPDGRKVKLYALPVNGILYKPVGYNKPVVLNFQDYFVIYDVAAKTGKIAENTPEIYNLFKPRVYDEIWQAMDSDKVFDDLNNLCDNVLLAHLHKARLDRLGTTDNIKTLVQEARGEVYRQLGSTSGLLPYLQQLPQVRQATKGFKAYVVELPVEGLVWVDKEVEHRYNPQDHVMLFFEMGAVGVYPRADVENPALFTSVK